jgi:hypothetical protein
MRRGEAWPGRPFIGARRAQGSLGDGGRWCALKGSIDGVHFCHEEGAMMGEGKGMRMGWHPLRGGEVVDGEAAGLCDASTLGREVAAAACSGKEKGVQDWARLAGRLRPRGVEVARPSGQTGPKRWAGPIWLLGLKQRKNFFLNFKLNFGI